MKLVEAMELYTSWLVGAGRSPRTVASYQQRFRRLLLYHEICREMDLESITPEMLDRWAASLAGDQSLFETNEFRPTCTGRLSPASRHGYIQAAKTFFNWCARRGYVTVNPAAYLEKPQLQHGAEEKLMSREDLYLMLKAAESHLRDLALLMFAVDTGARRGEIASLTTPGLMLDRRDAWVVGKTGRRLVDFTSKTAEVMTLWLAERPLVSHDYVFVSLSSNTYGQPLTVWGVYGVFKRLGRRAGVKGRFNPHALRHLVGQSWVDHVNLELTRQKLGHKSVSTTAMIYAHQDRSRLKAATTFVSLSNHLRTREEDDKEG